MSEAEAMNTALLNLAALAIGGFWVYQLYVKPYFKQRADDRQERLERSQSTELQLIRARMQLLHMQKEVDKSIPVEPVQDTRPEQTLVPEVVGDGRQVNRKQMH